MISGIVLAAGESRRMGRQKLLLPYGASTVIEHIVDQALASSLTEVVVVTGHDREEVTKALDGRNVTLTHNATYQEGMLSSVRCGLHAARRDCAGVMILLGDQPAICTSLLDELVRSFEDEGEGIVVPVHEGRRGHPLVFSARYREEVLTRFDDVGLRGLLDAHPDALRCVELNRPEVLSDMDTPEDYAREVDGRKR